MEVKQMISIDVKKGDYTFSFLIPMGSTWGSAIDAAYETLQQLGKMSQENAEKLKPLDPNED